MTNATDAMTSQYMADVVQAAIECLCANGFQSRTHRLTEVRDRLRATPAGSASGDGMCYCQEDVICPACEIADGGPYNGIDWQATCETLQAEVARLQGALAEARREWPLWRNRWVSDRTSRICEVDCVSYEMARAQAESEAVEYEATFNAATERLAMGSANGQG